MASYRPSNDIVIPEPCSEEWEAMTGDARTRHCAQCSSDVYNLAALTPRQIEALLADPDHLPCMRIARFEDGSLLVAEEMRAQRPYGMMAGAAMAALVVLSSGVAGAQTDSGRADGGRTMGKIAPPPATYSGQVLTPDGKPAAGVTVFLRRDAGGKEEREETKTDATGTFRLITRAGTWQAGATDADGNASAVEPVKFQPGESKVSKAMRLRWVIVTAGAPVMVTPPKKDKGPAK